MWQVICNIGTCTYKYTYVYLYFWKPIRYLLFYLGSVLVPIKINNHIKLSTYLSIVFIGKTLNFRVEI